MNLVLLRLCVFLLASTLVFDAVAEVRVEVQGLSGAEEENVKARLALPPRTEREDLSEEALRRLLRPVEEGIARSLQPFGYYSPQIRLDLRREQSDWRAIYTVDPGPPTLLREIVTRFEGENAQLEPLVDTIEKIDLESGERLRHPEYEAAKERMTDVAYAQGLLDAHWLVHELRVMPEAQVADVELRMETGPRYFFGEVSVEQDQIRPQILQRYIPIREGEPFDPQKLLDLQFVFSDLGYFQTVEIEALRAQADAQRRVPIRVSTTPRPRRRFDFGVGYGTDTRARASIGTQWRRLNDRGHTLTTNFQLSEIKNTLTADYRLPLGTKAGENLSFTAGSETERLKDGDTLKYAIGASLNRGPGDWKRRLYLEFAHEESDFGEQKAIADLLTPGVSFTRTEANDPIYARRGWFLFVDLHGAQEGLLSNTGFVQTRGIVRIAAPLGARARLLARAEVGVSVVQEFQELPASQRFFAGGDQSVRGYTYQSLGPRDDDGRVVGGRYLSTFSVEVERSLWRDWGAAVFMDIGGADDQPDPELSRGVGLGVRYRAPVGSLRVDLAHPLDDPDTTVRLHLGISVGL